MSYNATANKVKRIEGVQIPLSALGQAEKVDYDPDADLYCFSFGECCNLTGKKLDDALVLEEFEWWGEFSGNAYSNSLIPALKQSKGTLEVVFIWEGGDSIERLTAVDGEVKENVIEL